MIHAIKNLIHNNYDITHVIVLRSIWDENRIILFSSQILHNTITCVML